MTKDTTAEVRIVVSTRDSQEVTVPLRFRQRNQGPGGEGPDLGLWVHRAGQHDLEAAQGSGEFCRHTAGGLKSDNIYRAQIRQLGCRGWGEFKENKL